MTPERLLRATNHNKHSAIVNLKHPQGVRGAQAPGRQRRRADRESFRPGVLTRLGLDREGFRTINPRLIVCALAAMARGGICRQSGRLTSTLRRWPGLIGRWAAPTNGRSGCRHRRRLQRGRASICAALFARERTGEGACIDCALFDAAIPFFSSTWVEANARHDPDQIDEIGLYGRLAGKLACYNIYRARDDEYVALAALEPKFWDNFCRTVERPDLIPGYEKWPPVLPDRRTSGHLRRADRRRMEAILGRADCASHASTPPSPRRRPHVRSRGLLSVSSEGVPWLRSPLRSRQAPPVIGQAPGYSQHHRWCCAKPAIPRRRSTPSSPVRRPRDDRVQQRRTHDHRQADACVELLMQRS
ncbi:MAG: CoA transferase [Chloroflexi bacterium]|nr:CoA transferase [Chloroflexota bacterium]